MIGRLQGVLLEKQPPSILIDVQGVGYELEASMSTFYHLPECGEKIVFTYALSRAGRCAVAVRFLCHS